jgi:aryl-alcohol dehydrogenase-like predicted oxidoreductase
MRMSTDESRAPELAVETIAAAAGAGMTVFDTARAYGDNERLLASALRGCGVEGRARIVTKGGMARPEGRWVPDGRAKAILADCDASLEALDGLEIDLYLIHAPDPRTPWRTSLRALARLADEGLVRRVGVSNVNRDQLDDALELVPVAAVQVALSPYDDHALRGGVVARCVERGVAVIAHSPLGGPRRAGRLARREGFADVAEAHAATPAEVALAWLLGLSPAVVPIPGARRPETARSAARAAGLELTASERSLLGAPRSARRPAAGDASVVLIMGIPGAGKSLAAEEYTARGYVRLNRDERKGSLRELAETLDEQLAAGVRRVVLDNTYLTRASRSYVLDAVGRYGVPARCVWLDTPLAQAQVNLVERLLERFGVLPTPEELRETAKREPGLHLPTTQMRTLRELEPPSSEEGFADLER